MAVAVYPERMDQIDPEDVEASLRTLETYIHYICERTEFALTNTFRTTTGLGSSAEANSLVLQDTVDDLNALESTVVSLTSTVNGKVDKVEGMGLSTNDYTDEDKADVTGIDDLDDRVTALEDIISSSGPILYENASDVTAANGTDAIFSVRVMGTGLTYKWEMLYGSDWIYPNFSGRDTAQMTVPATTARNGYRFRCTITGGGWKIYSNTVMLTVTS